MLYIISIECQSHAKPCYLSRTLLRGLTQAREIHFLCRLASALGNGLAALATVRESSRSGSLYLRCYQCHMHLLRSVWIISLQRACMNIDGGECILTASETGRHCTSLDVVYVHAAQVGGQPRRPVQGAKPWVMKGKKRSEVDRRLDTLVGPSGKLKDGSMAAVVGMLRLFNLCDVAPTITQADLPRPGRQGRAASPVPASAPAQVPMR